MGIYEKEGNDLIYRQETGEITARLLGYEERSELEHEGSRRYKAIFYLLAAAGVLYLVFIFASY
jgi:hypothetical protein